MIHTVLLPKTNENMHEATLSRWFKAEGDAVSEKTPLVEVITDKATFELESPGAGILRRIVFPDKSVVPVGAIIALIADPEEVLPDVEAHNAALLSGARKELEALADLALADGAKKVRATPSAKKLAKEKGVSLEDVAKSLQGDHRITEEDVEAFLKGRENG